MRSSLAVDLLTLVVLASTLHGGESEPASSGDGAWWAFRSIHRPALPGTAGADRSANPIDRFINARLEEAGLEAAPDAERRDLLRRLSFDLAGLPVTIGEVEAFERDSAPDAYERLVDRLLSSPRYGERWARHWLDVVRFAETNGYERDATKPQAWRYRDYVVDAFNADRPFDRFVLEQLAGDELPGRNEETVIATGFLRLGTWDDEPNVPAEYVYERLEDLVHTTSSAFIGLTVKCARCHDHKFDPIPQREYYEFASAFWAGPIEPRDRNLLGGPTREELGFDVLGWTDRGREVPPFHLLKSGDPHRPLEVVQPGALSLAGEVEAHFRPPEPTSRTTQRRLQLARWITDSRNPLTARVIVNRLWQQHFGAGIVATPNNFGTKGAVPSHPLLLDWLAAELVESGWSLKHVQRLIVTSRTYRMSSRHARHEEYEKLDSSNRLLWRFPRRRLDAEALRDAMLAVGGDLNLRLGGPSFFPSLSPEALEGLSRKGATWGESSPDEERRRSLYIFAKRSLLVPLMTVFDFCDTTASCPRRDVTTVAPQALALLNNHFVHARSRTLAERVVRKAGEDPRRRVEHAWKLAFARLPTPRELEAALAHLEEQECYYRSLSRERSSESRLLALSSLCHVLLNTNEFIYVD